VYGGTWVVGGIKGDFDISGVDVLAGRKWKIFPIIRIAQRKPAIVRMTTGIIFFISFLPLDNYFFWLINYDKKYLLYIQI